MKKWIYLSVVLLLAYNSFAAIPNDNASQWRGAARDGIYYEDNLLTKWPDGGPELTDTVEHLTALDLNGGVKWQANYGRAWYRDFPHARCTPTVDGDKVYVISGSGDVACFDAVSGKNIWSVPVHKKFKGAWGVWGTAENPLIVDEKVIYTPCGEQTTMVTLDKNSGETVWQSNSLNDTSAYVSPIKIDYAGKQIIVQVTANRLIGVDAQDGAILFQHSYSEIQAPDHPMAPYINTVSPLYHDGQIYITSGYDHAGVAFKLNEDASEVSVAWVDKVLDVHHGGVVLIDGVLYGSNWLDNRRGNWCAIDWETGKKLYEKEWFTKGSIIYADGLLYCYEERRGHVALVKPNPENFEVISSFQVLEGTGPYWAHPVINDGVLYVRHGKALMAYKIR